MRPQEIFSISDADEATMDATFMSSGQHIDLVQDVTTDCSVVAGLSAAIGILTGRHSVGSQGLFK
jgi:hypothetical protein